MTIHETEAVTTRDGKTYFHETRRNYDRARDGKLFEPVDVAGVAVACVMALGPLFAYAVGFGA